ncbi:MAG: PAS domain S-box protein [Verrucomicrobiales bacterium]|nr:PAS domain S-box protein [Verrucomicrobiales bacterium]
MKTKLNILHLEDNPDDAIIIQALLGQDGFGCEMNRVQTRDQFVAALERGGFDLILSDFSLPAFDGIGALKLARERCPDVPFLFVSGTLGEEVAIDSLKCGATDYVLKERLARLAPAVRRAMEETEKKRALRQAEEAMIQSEQKYRQLFDCLSDAALLTDASTGRVLDTNRQAKILLSRERSEMIGQNQSQFHTEATLEEYRRRFADLGEQPQRTAFEGEVLAKDGRTIPVSISATPIVIYGRRLILALYRDITERKRDEERIRMLKREAEQHLWLRTREVDVLHNELEIYSRLATHELRRRAGAIGTAARQAQTRRPAQSDATADSALKTIQDKAAEMEHLMERALAFRELRRKHLDRSVLDMNAIAKAAFEEVKLQCPEREVRFKLEDLPPGIGDAVEIREVFLQLLSNALKFTRPRNPAEIKIGGRTEETQTAYYVSDNGVGFAPKNADKLFGTFQRLHSQEEFEGIGLGLALVQRIIERHGGQVRAEGKLNGGAIFSVALPKQVETHDYSSTRTPAASNSRR